MKVSNSASSSRHARAVAGLTVAAVLLAGAAVAGCSDRNTASILPGAAPPDPVPSATTPAASGTCYAWNGLGGLNGMAFPLRELASDDEIYGQGSAATNSASMAVDIAAMGISRKWTELPSPYAEDVENEVIVVADGASAASPEQLDAAADNAEYLAGQIARLCYSNP